MMKKCKKFFYSCLVFVVLGCSNLSPHDSMAQDPILAPSELNASKNFFDGKYVKVKGVLIIGPSARVLWETEEDYQNGDAERKCITLLNTKIIFDNFDFFYRKRVIIAGVFRKNIHDDTSEDTLMIDLGSCGFTGILIDDEFVMKKYLVNYR